MKIVSRLLQTCPVTISFIVLCVVVYLAMIYTGAHFADPHNQALIAWGGNYRPLTVTGQGWRLFTSLFVHGGLLHLCMNMIALLDIGRLLEQKIGRRMVFVIFILSGLFGGICSLIWHPLTVGVGASGAILGLAGALLVWLALPKLERAAEIERIVLVRALIIGLILTLGMGQISSRIDNAAHAGGLAAGILLGALVYLLDRLNPGALKRWAAAGILLVAGGALVWQQLRAQTADEYRFRKPLPEIARVIEQYRDVSRYLQTRIAREQSDAGSVAAVDGKVQRSGKWVLQAYQQAIGAWENCLYLTQPWQNLKLQKDQKQLSNNLIAYCNLRQRQYFFLRQALQKPGQEREIAALAQQAQAMEPKMLSALRSEMALDRYIQDQLGMTMMGKKRVMTEFERR